MGAGTTCGFDRSEKRLLEDEEVIRVYLEEDGDISKVWERFDADRGGEIDHKEFDRVLMACFRFFIRRIDPEEADHMPRSELRPFVETLASDLHKMIDPNGDGVLDESEFVVFSNYLKSEFQKLQAYLMLNAPSRSLRKADLTKGISLSGKSKMAES